MYLRFHAELQGTDLIGYMGGGESSNTFLLQQNDLGADEVQIDESGR